MEKNLPLSYREDIVKQFFYNFIKGESFSFIGIKDNCKINLLRFVALRPDVQKKYLGNKAQNFIFSLIDLNQLPEVSLSNFYHLLALSLGIKLNNSEINNPLLGMRRIKNSLKAITNKTGKKIILLFNNFDLLLSLNLKDIYHNLVAISQDTDSDVIFVFTGNRPFDLDTFFFKKIIWMTPFSKYDALDIVKRNQDLYGVKISQDHAKKIIELSGGHGGLIKFIIQEISNLKKPSTVDILLDRLYENSDVCFQCERILSTLNEVEKAKLASSEPDEFLINLGLQNKNNNQVRVFSPLLDYYLHNSKCLEAFCFDRENDIIYLWGKSISKNLTSYEYTFLRALLENPQKVFKRDEIMAKIWGENNFPSDWALDKLVSRLRKKLGETSKSPKFFKILRNKGITLNQTSQYS